MWWCLLLGHLGYPHMERDAGTLQVSSRELVKRSHHELPGMLDDKSQTDPIGYLFDDYTSDHSGMTTRAGSGSLPDRADARAGAVCAGGRARQRAARGPPRR
eukprot:585663-Prymnesium_polylepis.1